MFECTRCGLKKAAYDFYYTNSYRRKYCKKCEHKRKAINFYIKKQKAVNYLGGKCVKCGYNQNIEALDFDHINPSTKKLEPSIMLRGRKWEEVISELDKCQILCAICHRIKTSQEQKNRL